METDLLTIMGWLKQGSLVFVAILVLALVQILVLKKIQGKTTNRSRNVPIRFRH
ncbi:MAG: hypothetical protein H3C47_16400 [Candidatus Cloacimonetes bacterium]|nr:hypothetical protein [Candidatus Cloacimonadota bacterium]